jgi:transposase
MTATRTLIGSVNAPTSTLYVAFELSAKSWKLAMTPGLGIAPWVKGVAAGDWVAVGHRIARAKTRFGLSATTTVVSCYEAGRDGFWIHRALLVQGISNRVVDSASIEVSRRRRRAKTDRIDARKLVQMLVRAALGETRVWREVHVPSASDEAARHVSRERQQLTQEQTRLVNQLRSWLASSGAALPTRRDAGWWTRVRDWAGTALPPALQARLARAHERLQLVAAQLTALTQAQQVAARLAPADSALRRLIAVKGLAVTGASVLLEEGLIWREFRNRRQVGGLLGFTPVPYQSGELVRDQGIDRAGNARWRAVSIQLAWRWVQWQPHSALTQWYQRRFGHGGPRARRIGIVALARKLIVALWRYATTGVLPAGAIVKTA